MAKMGRPKKEFNQELFEELCKIQCTEQEIAAVMDMSIELVNQNCKSLYGLTFLDVYAQKRAAGKPSMRRKQYQKAMDGDTTMLIWLGKNMLEQRDRVETDINLGGDGLQIILGAKPDSV